MANYDVVSEPDLGRSQMAWVCKYQDFLPAINVEAHGSESWFRPLVVFMARGPEVDHCHRARLQFSTKA